MWMHASVVFLFIFLWQTVKKKNGTIQKCRFVCGLDLQRDIAQPIHFHYSGSKCDNSFHFHRRTSMNVSQWVSMVLTAISQRFMFFVPSLSWNVGIESWFWSSYVVTLIVDDRSETFKSQRPNDQNLSWMILWTVMNCFWYDVIMGTSIPCSSQMSVHFTSFRTVPTDQSP